MKLIRILSILCTLIVPISAANANADECEGRPYEEIVTELTKEGFGFKFKLTVLPGKLTKTGNDVKGARFEHPDGSFAVVIDDGDSSCIAFKFIAPKRKNNGSGRQA